MKKLLLSAVALLAFGAHAFDKTTWNPGYTVTSVRQNGNNWIAFQVVPKNTSSSGNIVSDYIPGTSVSMYFGVPTSDPRYKEIFSMIVAAKSTGRTVNFCGCNLGYIAGTSNQVAYIGGIDIE